MAPCVVALNETGWLWKDRQTFLQKQDRQFCDARLEESVRGRWSRKSFLGVLVRLWNSLPQDSHFPGDALMKASRKKGAEEWAATEEGKAGGGTELLSGAAVSCRAKIGTGEIWVPGRPSLLFVFLLVPVSQQPQESRAQSASPPPHRPQREESGRHVPPPLEGIQRAQSSLSHADICGRRALIGSVRLAISWQNSRPLCLTFPCTGAGRSSCSTARIEGPCAAEGGVPSRAVGRNLTGRGSARRGGSDSSSGGPGISGACRRWLSPHWLWGELEPCPLPLAPGRGSLQTRRVWLWSRLPQGRCGCESGFQED